jgi:hypothetical protein
MQDGGLLMIGETNRPSDGRRESDRGDPSRQVEKRAHGSPDLTPGDTMGRYQWGSKGHRLYRIKPAPLPTERSADFAVDISRHAPSPARRASMKKQPLSVWLAVIAALVGVGRMGQCDDVAGLVDWIQCSGLHS